MTTIFIQTAMVNDSGNPLVPPIRDLPALAQVSWISSVFNVTTAFLALQMVGCAIQLLQKMYDIFQICLFTQRATTAISSS